MNKLLFVFGFSCVLTLCKGQTKPNIIFILADDIGYEIPTVNGGQSYSTPFIDSMARHGMNFTHCEATPLCSPSRFMLLTGKYNFRNYSIWGFVNNGEKTIGNMMKDAGYTTGWFGKLQTYSHDSDILNFGFDDYLVFEALDLMQGSRYKSPLLYKNGGKQLPASAINNKYADDILTQRLFAFIDSNKTRPFFAYYPMSLCHTPLSPTPDDPEFATWLPSAKSDTSFFSSMTKYMDKKVGQILQKLRDVGLDRNTIVIFVGDNGTTLGIESLFNNQLFAAGKGQTNEAGTHVPMMIYWPGHIAEGSVNNDLIDFTDFFPTIADAAGVTNTSAYGVLDGKSFYPRLSNQPGQPREWIFCHYDPEYSIDDSVSRWVQNKTYKLYDTSAIYKSGKFFNIVNDKNEQHPLDDAALSSSEKTIKKYLLSILDTMPKPPAKPVLTNPVIKDITETTVTAAVTIMADGGAPIVERGSLLLVPPGKAFYQDNRLADSGKGLGTFEQTRIKLKPQTRYSYSFYARNTNKSNAAGFITGPTFFFTKSNPPLKQPVNFTASADACSVNLKWSSATFPNSNATKAGYVIVYSPSLPTLIPNFRQVAPDKIALNGKVYITASSVLPAYPDTSAYIPNLFTDSFYNFLLIPFTWDGINLTYNYLTNGALTVTAKPLTLNINTSVTNLVCYGVKSGAIKVVASKGTAPYTFSLNDGPFVNSNVFANLNADSYLVKVKDLVGCYASTQVVIIQPDPITFTNTYTNARCNGAADGTVILKATGGTIPYKYSFDNSFYDTTSAFSALSAGLYTAKVKDGNNCIASQLVTIMQPNPLQIADNHTSISCNGLTNGSITLNATGGTVPYQFSFNHVAYNANAVINNLAAGTYTINVTDSNSCAATLPVIITQPKPLNLTSQVKNVTSFSNGTVILTANGGTSPYKYSFNGGAFSAMAIFDGLSPDTYSVSVRDSLGCTLSDFVTLKQSAPLIVAALPNPSQSLFRLYVSSNNTNEQVHIKVVTVTGKTVYTASGPANSSYYFGATLSTGVYFALVVQGDNIRAVKIIKI